MAGNMAKKTIGHWDDEAASVDNAFGKSSTQAEKAEYIADMTGALCETADKAGLCFLAYLLDMAHEEAKKLKRVE